MLRAEYLFDFANLCHIPPPVVDALCYADFIRLIFCIDQVREARKREQQEWEKHRRG